MGAATVFVVDAAPGLTVTVKPPVLPEVESVALMRRPASGSSEPEEVVAASGDNELLLDTRTCSGKTITDIEKLIKCRCIT